jgi:hypothetical protein
MAKGNLNMQMVIFMMEIGKMVKHMDMEFLYIIQEVDIKGIGKTILNMDLVLKLGQMGINIKVNMLLERKMDRAIIFGTMEVIIKEIGLIIKLKVLVYMYGVIKGNMKVIG